MQILNHRAVKIKMVLFTFFEEFKKHLLERWDHVTNEANSCFAFINIC